MGYRIVHRRNNAGAGIVLLVAGLLMLLSSFQALATVTTPGIDIGSKLIGLTLTPNGSFDPSPIELWFWTAGFTIGFGLILLLTRVRGLGIVWRIFAFIPLLIMGIYAGFVWYYVGHPDALLASSDQDVSGTVLQGAAKLAESLNLIQVSPGVGLILLSAAILIGVIAIFLPSGKSQKYVPTAITGGMMIDPRLQSPYQQPYPQQGYPPQPPYPQQYPAGQYPQYPQQQQPPYPQEYPRTGS